ncbi:MAG TPA: hypothetical protein PKJ68_04525 [Candidatus Woesebacteria bacterium]|nr:hypothetical protein [Candidatus Woesebacteria bacterium]
MARNLSAIKPSQGMAHLWLRQEKKAEQVQKGADPEDVELAALDEHPGWAVMKEHIAKLKDGIDQKLSEGVTSGQTAEEIGKSTILAVMAKQLLDSIVNKVDDAVLAVEEFKHEGNKQI